MIASPLKSYVLAAALGCALTALPAGAQQCAGDAFLCGAPLTLEQVRQAVGVLYEGRLAKAISNRGVDFQRGEEQIELLRRAGATPAILDELKRAAGPPPAGGPLQVECQPAECAIEVGGFSRGPTTQGRLEISGLKPGEWEVRFSKPGYLPELTRVVLPVGSPASLSVRLKPELTSREKLARRLLEGVSTGLGTANKSGGVALTGRLQVDGTQGRSWEFRARLQPDGRLTEIEVDAGGPRHIEFSSQNCMPEVPAAAGLEAPEFRESLRLFCTFTPGALLMRVLAGDFQLSVDGPFISTAREWIVRAAGRDGSFEFAFSGGLLLASLKYRPVISAPAVEVQYSAYLAVRSEKAPPEGQAPVYPGRISISSADAAAHTVEFAIATALSDSRY